LSKSLITSIIILVVGVAAIMPFVSQKAPTQIANEKSKKDLPKTALVKPKPVVKTIELVERLPDFKTITDVKTKKRTFFEYLKPMVLEVNEQIASDRAFLLTLKRTPTDTNSIQRFKGLVRQYRVKQALSFDKKRQQLLSRVDILPVELVLMQAANESGWGTSRFAVQANNLFGQWCFKVGCGVVPEGRPEGKTYEVRKFARPVDSIKSYFRNLNTGYAYEELRKLRQTLRAMKQDIDPYIVAEGLTPYSTRRDEYVLEIQNMIRVNKKYI